MSQPKPSRHTTRLDSFADQAVRGLAAYFASEITNRSRGAVNRLRSELDHADQIVGDVKDQLGQSEQPIGQDAADAAHSSLSKMRGLVPEPDEAQVQDKIVNFALSYPATTALVSSVCLYTALKFARTHNIR